MRSNKASPLPFPVRVPFVESLGVELHAMGDGHAEVRVDLDEAHLNAWEVAHGGVVMTLMDVAMALSARSTRPHGVGVATVEMKTNFMRPAQHQLRVLGKVRHHTSSLAFCEAELFDDSGQLCATASATFKFLRALAKRGKAHGAAATGPGAPANTPTTPTHLPEDDTP